MEVGTSLGIVAALFGLEPMSKDESRIARCCHAQMNIFAAREKSIRMISLVKTNFEAVFVLFFADPKRWDSNFVLKARE